jgi:hypothetical protein
MWSWRFGANWIPRFAGNNARWASETIRVQGATLKRLLIFASGHRIVISRRFVVGNLHEKTVFFLQSSEARRSLFRRRSGSVRSRLKCYPRYSLPNRVARRWRGYPLRHREIPLPSPPAPVPSARCLEISRRYSPNGAKNRTPDPAPGAGVRRAAQKKATRVGPRRSWLGRSFPPGPSGSGIRFSRGPGSPTAVWAGPPPDRPEWS